MGGAFQLLDIEMESSDQRGTSSLTAAAPSTRLAKLTAIKVNIGVLKTLGAVPYDD